VQYNVQWFRFSSLSNTWTSVATQTQVSSGNYNNGTPGGYRVVVSDLLGAIILEDICWISRINSPPVVNANTLQPGCGSVQLSGLYFPGNITGYYNPPPVNFNDPYLFNSATSIELCFDINHPILSDLKIELKSPPSCGSQTIILTATQTPANADSICYNSDAVDLCFSNSSNVNYDLCELGGANVSGVFGSYGVNAQPIDWTQLQGCDVTQPGWAVHLYDCYGGANGFWESATMSISDDSGNGLPINLEFFPTEDQGNAILDTGCDSSLFTVIELERIYPQATLLSQGVGIVWETNPPIELPNNGVGLTLLLNPGPTQDVYFSLSLSNIELGDACGAQPYDVEFYDYIQPDSSVISLTDSVLCLTDEPIFLTSTFSAGSWSGPVVNSGDGVVFDPAEVGVGLYAISFEPVSSCIDPTEVFVLVDEAPILILPDVQGFCGLDSLVELEASPQGGVWQGVGITDSIGGIFNPVLVLSGLSTLSYTAGVNCPSTSSVNFIVEPFIPLQIVNSDTTICDQSQPLNLQVNLSNTEWQGAGITSSSSGIFNPGLAGAGEHIIIANYNQLCHDSDTLVIKVDAGMLNIASLIPVCEGSDTLDLEVVADSGIWTGIGIIDSLEGFVDLGLLESGNNQFYYTLRNACAYTDSVTLFVEEFIPLQVLTNDTSICVESSVLNLESNLSLVQWQGEGIISENEGEFDPAQAGIGEFLIVANYNQACSSSDSVLVQVDDGALSISPLEAVCEGTDTLSLQVVADSGVWVGNGIIDSLQGYVDLGLLTPGNNQFYYTLRNACSFTDSVTLYVEEFIPLQILSNDTAVCAESAIFSLESNLTPVDWQGAGIVSFEDGQFSPTLAGVGEYVIVANYSQACTSRDSILVRVEDSSIALEPLSPICVDAVTLNLLAMQGEGVWSGMGVVDAAQGVVDPAQLEAGIHFFTYTLSNSCANSDSVSVVVVDFPVIELNLPQGICVDQSAIDVSANLPGGQFSGNGIEGASPNWLFNPLLAGEGTITIQYDYTDVCTSIVLDSIEVYPLPVLTISADTTICPEGSAQLIVAGAAQYSWSPSTSLSSPELPITEAQPEFSTLYTVQGISGDGCTTSEEVLVNVYSSPIPTTNGPIELCKGESEVLQVLGLSSAQWTGPSLESPEELLTVASPTESTTYTVVGFDENGCIGDTTLEVIVYDPIALFSPSDTLGTPPMEVSFDNLSAGDYFIWDFGNGDSLLTDNINEDVSAIFDGEQFHTIMLTAFLNGCPAVFSYTIETYYDSELLVVPNVVSVNGDGKNDTWRVLSRNMAEMKVDIFNRWGNLIERVDGINDSWDPKEVASGTYFYRLLAVGLDGELYNREGEITVLSSEN
jgi:gliding motility-associated-like protein